MRAVVVRLVLAFIVIGVAIWLETLKIHACMSAWGLSWWQCMLLFGGSKH